MRKSYGYHLITRVSGSGERYDSPIVKLDRTELPEFIHGFCEGVRSVLFSSSNLSVTFDVQVYVHEKRKIDGRLVDVTDLFATLENR